eukprot:TRINITY_DN3032_c0_g1_i1.p1 TRINITY_DN3032_c0_g1~~TRINITY_DN3032_c0_g1_i1.p1  ORF type:complete len:112 (+),score=11.72 TRINITY_DN3032_c0_g1_i1:74-409(+)
MSQWDIELCDCFSDCKTFLVSWFCSPCQLAYQKVAVEETQPCGFGDCILPCLFSLCCAVSIRGKIRAKYGIDGGCMGDFCVILFCYVCAVTQQTRQLNAKGAKPAGMFMDP